MCRSERLSSSSGNEAVDSIQKYAAQVSVRSCQLEMFCCCSNENLMCVLAVRLRVTARYLVSGKESSLGRTQLILLQGSSPGQSSQVERGWKLSQASCHKDTDPIMCIPPHFWPHFFSGPTFQIPSSHLELGFQHKISGRRNHSIHSRGYLLVCFIFTKASYRHRELNLPFNI